MFCLNCGTDNADDSKFCKECGSLVGASTGAAMRGRSMHTRLSPHIAEDLGAGDDANPHLQRLMELALWHSQAGNLAAAILSCETALLINGDNVSALSLLGCLYERQGQVDKAIAVFERVVRISPDSEADVEKLSALKRGEYMPPVQQPFGYRWMPPMLVKLSSGGKSLPIGIGAVAALLVLGIGLASLLSHGSATTEPAAPASVATIADNPVVQNSAATHNPSLAQNTSAPAPVTIVSASTHSIGADAPLPAMTTVNAPLVPAPSQVDFNRQISGSRAQRVPPLAAAVNGNSSVPSVTSIKPLDVQSVKVASSAELPEHTVVIAPPYQSNGGAPASGGSAADSEAEQPQPSESHVYVHIHADTAASAAVPALAASSTAVPQPIMSSAGAIGQSRGARLQSEALLAQQRGDYKSAARQYRGAINAYHSEINQGEFVSEAQRGVEACETGLQICQENQ